MNGAKTDPSSSKASTSDLIQHISSLEKQLTSPTAESLNPLVDLVEIVQTCDDLPPKIVHAAMYATYRVFVVLIQRGRFKVGGGDGGDDDDESVQESRRLVRKWLSERLSDFDTVLMGLLKDEEKSLRVRNTFFFFILAGLSMLTDFFTCCYFAFNFGCGTDGGIRYHVLPAHTLVDNALGIWDAPDTPAAFPTDCSKLTIMPAVSTTLEAGPGEGRVGEAYRPRRTAQVRRRASERI